MDKQNFSDPELYSVPRWVLFKSLLNNLSYKNFTNQAQNDDQAVIIDVRTPDEFMAGTLPGAINLNYLSNTLADEIEQLDPSHSYYIFCRTGRRSLRVCMLLRNLGCQIYNLDEGIRNQLETGEL